MQRIDHIVRAEAKRGQPAVDTVSLTWEERQKSRQTLQLEVMRRDAQKMRGARPCVFTNFKSGAGVPGMAAWLEWDVLFVA